MKANLIIKSNCIFDSVSATIHIEGFVAVKGNRIMAVEKGSDLFKICQGDDTIIKEFGD